MLKQKIITLGDLEPGLAEMLLKMMSVSFEDIYIQELEKKLTDAFSPNKDASKELFYSEKIRLAFAAGWIFKYNGIELFAAFSRDTPMYIGDKYNANEDIPANLNKIDVITASRIVWPNGGYSTGGKIQTLRENEAFKNTKIHSLFFSLESVSYEKDTQTGDEAYMPVGILNLGEISDDLFEQINSDKFITVDLIDKVNQVDTNNLTSKSELFFKMISWFL